MTNNQQRLWLWGLFAASAVMLLGIATAVNFFRLSGIRVTVKNCGESPMKSVILHVTGGAVTVGDLAPNTEITARVEPRGGESHLEVEFTDARGQRHRVIAGGYFEPGYRGTIRVEINDGKVEKFEEHLSVW